MSDLNGYKTIIPPFPETQPTEMSDLNDYKSIIPPFPETQPTDAWIEDEDQPKMENSELNVLHCAQ